MFKRLFYILLFATLSVIPVRAEENTDSVATQELNVKKLIFEHIGDAYEWHIVTIGDKHVSIPLPIIVYSERNGLKIFLSSRLSHAENYEGYCYGSEGGKYPGKIVEINENGEEVRPWDFSLTKNALALFINCILI